MQYDPPDQCGNECHLDSGDVSFNMIADMPVGIISFRVAATRCRKFKQVSKASNV